MKRILLLAASAAPLLGVLGCGPKVSPVAEVSVESSGVAITAAEVTTSAESDWPVWRGPAGNGVAPDQPIPTTWDQNQHVIWRTEVPGRGHASPTVVGDQVFLATADESTQEQSVVAFNRTDGQQQWKTVVSTGGFPGSSQMHPKSTHANATLACDGTHLFGAFLANDEVTAFALNLAGESIWTQAISTFNSKFGYAPSPTLYQSTVIFAADNRGGGCLAALDRQTGQIAWRKPRPPVATYSSPVIADVAGREQLLISGCNALTSYDPRSGDELWSCSGTAEATCGTVVWNENHVFASGGYPESETICVLADGSGQRVWRVSAKAYEPSMVLVGDYLYLVTDKGIAHCFAASDGSEQWKKRLSGSFSASPVVCNGLIYATNDRGRTFVIEATPTGCQVVAENQLGSDAYASPAVSNGQLFLRIGTSRPGGRQEELVCLGSPPETT